MTSTAPPWGRVPLKTGTSLSPAAQPGGGDGHFEKPRFDNPARPNQSLHTVPGKWGALLSLESGGICLEWLRKASTPPAGGRAAFAEGDRRGRGPMPGRGKRRVVLPLHYTGDLPAGGGRLPSTLLGLTITQGRLCRGARRHGGRCLPGALDAGGVRRPACGRTDVDRRRGQKRPLDSDTGGCCRRAGAGAKESPTPPVSARPSWRGSARACSAMPARAAAQWHPKHARFTPMNRTGRCMKRATAASKAPCGRCRPVTANKRPVYENLSNERVMSHGIV